jgi:hypothetical protein
MAMIVPPPQPLQPSDTLLWELNSYLYMNKYEQKVAGLFLTSLGWDHLREIGTKSPIDFSVELEKYRASTGNAADIPEPTRSKLLAACEILKNGGSLEELRLIGSAHPSDLVNFSVG